MHFEGDEVRFIPVTVKAYYQTKFNKNAFVVDELPYFIFLGFVIYI